MLVTQGYGYDRSHALARDAVLRLTLDLRIVHQERDPLVDDATDDGPEHGHLARRVITAAGAALEILVRTDTEDGRSLGGDGTKDQFQHAVVQGVE